MNPRTIVNNLLETEPVSRNWCPRAWIDPKMPADALNFIRSNRRYSKWSKDGCEEASFSWANAFDQVLGRNRVKVVRGSYDGDFKSGVTPWLHYWVTVDGAIFDPTAEQFADYPNMDPSKYEGKPV